MLHAIHSVFPPTNITGHDGKDPLALKKLLAGNGIWAGWVSMAYDDVCGSPKRRLNLCLTNSTRPHVLSRSLQKCLKSYEDPDKMPALVCLQGEASWGPWTMPWQDHHEQIFPSGTTNLLRRSPQRPSGGLRGKSTISCNTRMEPKMISSALISQTPVTVGS
jgi:hypothetical protein